MSSIESFDAIVIGTGQGGKPLAGALAEAGWRVAIIEKDRVGGTCVIRGCTPTKTMIASARIAHLAHRASDYGVRVGEVSVDFAKVRERKRKIVDSWSAGSRRGLERHKTLELVMGAARFVSHREVEVALNDRGTRRLTSDRIFINVGARRRLPDLPGLDTVDFLDSESIMELDELPEHLIVLGGGFIGLEFAQMFHRFGAGVTVVERDRLASREDPDVSSAIEEIFTQEGIRVLSGADATLVQGGRNGAVELIVRIGETEERISGSHLLIAAGITPNSDTLNLESAGVEVDSLGRIRVNDRCETNVEGIWALGDATGAPPFTHVAYDDYRVIRQNLLGNGAGSRQGRMTPFALFIDPPLGRVGMSEREAEEAGQAFVVAKLPMTHVARAIEVDETQGFMKALIDPETDQVLGAAILGIEGSEVIAAIQMAMMGGLPWQTLRDSVIAHPTVSESLNNLFMTLG